MKIPKKLQNKWWLIIPIVIAISLIVTAWFKFETALSPIVPPSDKTVAESKKTTKKTTATQPRVPSFDKSRYSTTDPSSIWVIVNKQHPLSPVGYSPVDLVTTYGATISDKAKTDFKAMMATATSQGIYPTVVSSYRSYDTQVYIYNNFVSIYGQATADTFSARPGYSEHQTGYTIDFGSSNAVNCNLEECFSTTPEGQWLVNHASEYGFLLRYPAGKQQITGYVSEPWHFRYIGRELAVQMKNQSIITLEEFFNINGGEIYS